MIKENDKKIIGLYSLLLSLSIYFSCVDEGVDVPGGYQNAPETELLAYAKKLVGENGEGCSLIDLQKGSRNSRAVTDYSTAATPLWEKAKTERNGDEEVLIVPLQSEEEIHSSMYLEKEEMGRLYKTKTFSRLVIRSKDGHNIPQILTYLPGRNYAKNRQEVLDTMGFSPLAVKYYGTILISSLDGEFQQGFFYERGVPTLHLKAKGHNHTDVSCSPDDTTTCANHEHSHQMYMRLKLSRNVVSSSRSYNNTEESEYWGCINCGNPLSDCFCEGMPAIEPYCNSCKKPRRFCNCEFKCSLCQQLQCICDLLCSKCKKYPCECEEPIGEECEYCHSYNCNGECQESIPDTGGSDEDDLPEELFYNPNMTVQDRQLLEEMLEEIKDDCLGGELFNALRISLRGSVMPVQFTDIPYVGFASLELIDGSSEGIILNREAQSFHLFREMMHAYHIHTQPEALYYSTRLNGEIEALYAQYLYMSRLSGFRNSKWEKSYCSGMAFENVKKLEDVLDKKGNLKSGKNDIDLAIAVNAVATSLQKSSSYSNYSFDASKIGLENFSNLKTLTKRCQ